MNMENKSPIANFFVFLAEKSDGKKTIAGVLMLAGGIGTVFFTPEYRDEGIALGFAGLQLLIVGVAHKYVKQKNGAQADEQ